MILFNIMHTKSHPRNSEIAQAVGTYALDPVYRRVARDVRVTAMCWVEGIRPPQPERFHYFGGDFLYAYITRIINKN